MSIDQRLWSIHFFAERLKASDNKHGYLSAFLAWVKDTRFYPLSVDEVMVTVCVEAAGPIDEIDGCSV